MAIEVEKRALISKEQYDALPSVLAGLGATDLGENNTSSIFYIIDGQQLKVQVMSSKKTAKIAWKSGGWDGSSSRKEVELPFDYKDADSAEVLVDQLLPNAKKIPTTQLRHDYKLGELSIAVKFSENWQYHVEIDKVVESKEETSLAADEIQALADKLDIKLLTKAEEQAFTDAIISKN